MTGPTGVQSGVYLDGAKDLPFWYTRRMVETTIAAKPRTVLLLGGGAFTMAEYMARQLPNTHIDVVEIDPGLENISRQYFSYQSLPNVKLIFNDARTYIQHTDRRYDVVLIYRAAIMLSHTAKNRGQCLQQCLRCSRLAARFIPIISFQTTGYMKHAAGQHVSLRGKKYISKMLAISIYSVYSL